MSDSSEGMGMASSSVCPSTVDRGYEGPLSVGKDDDTGEGGKDGPCLCFGGLAHSAPSMAGGVQNSMLSRQAGAIGRGSPESSICRSMIAKMKSCAHERRLGKAAKSALKYMSGCAERPQMCPLLPSFLPSVRTCLSQAGLGSCNALPIHENAQTRAIHQEPDMATLWSRQSANHTSAEAHLKPP